MIKLTELLHIMDKDAKDGLVNIDDWRWSEASHLMDMKFEMMDDYRFKTPNKSTEGPEITVYQKEEMNEGEGKKTKYFYVEDKNRSTKKFENFNEVIEYFDQYPQEDID